MNEAQVLLERAAKNVLINFFSVCFLLIEVELTFGIIAVSVVQQKNVRIVVGNNYH